MRRIFGSRPTRFNKGDAVRLKVALPSNGLEAGMVGAVSGVRRTKLPSYDVQFIDAGAVVGRFVVDETDLMPADGRKYDENDVVRLKRGVPSQNLRVGMVGLVSKVSPGPPVEYVVEFVDAGGSVIARSKLFNEDLSSPDETPEQDAEAQSAQEPAEAQDETGLADDELDQLIAELRSQGQAMQEQAAQERASQAPRQAPQEEPVEQQEEAPEPPARPVEPPVQEAPGGDRTSSAPPSDGRRTRYIRGDKVRLDAPAAGFEAGSRGTVTWVILGSPVSYLVEFENASGGSSPPTKVEETYLSFDG